MEGLIDFFTVLISIVFELTLVYNIMLIIAAVVLVCLILWAIHEST